MNGYTLRGFHDELEKIAEGKRYGLLASAGAMNKALEEDEPGLATRKLQHVLRRSAIGSALGMAGGAALGGVLGRSRGALAAGALGGASLGFLPGVISGEEAAKNEHLRARGITPHWGGYRGATFSDKARKRYRPEEATKTAERDDTITRDKLKRFARVAAVGAAGTGLGYGVGHLVGRPVEKALLRSGIVGRNPARAAKVGIGLATGLGALAGLSRMAMGSRMIKEIQRDPSKRTHSR